MRNVAKFFAHLMCQDALPWSALNYISLTEEDTTSSSRIFIKILFQEMSEQLGVKQLSQKLQEQEVSDYTHGVLPSDTPKHTRFAINFFTQIGLGALTDGLRATLKQLAQKQQEQAKIRAQQEAERPEPQSKEKSSRNGKKDESRRSSDDYSESESRSDESYSLTGEDEKDQCQDLKEESAFIDWSAWSPVFKRALEREEGDQSGSSCVICFSSLSQNTEHGIALLSCSHRASLFSWSTSPLPCGSRAANTIPLSFRSPR